jgi:signal transduction histidine kinase
LPFRDLDQPQLRQSTQIGVDVVSNLDLESLFKQIVERAREITGAKYAALGILNASRDGLARFITAGMSEAEIEAIGEYPSGRGVLGLLIEHPEPIRMHRVSEHEASFGFPEHHPHMESFLGAPVKIEGEAYGHLYLTDKEDGDFDDDDQAAVEALAMWAAIAINNAQYVRADRLRSTIAAAENERHRWALELHDETLQGLGALRIMLAAAQRSGNADTMKSAIDEALEQLSLEITGLRGLITELRPAALDSLGLEAALESLARRVAATADFNLEIELKFDNPGRTKRATENEIAAYRLVQEALTNAAKHSRASHVSVVVRRTEESIEINVTDNGVGFDTDQATEGFGLSGMRERLALSQSVLTISSAPGDGTTVAANLIEPLQTT